MHLVLLERLRGPALGLQRPHQDDPAGLPQRVLDHERLQQRRRPRSRGRPRAAPRRTARPPPVASPRAGSPRSGRGRCRRTRRTHGPATVAGRAPGCPRPRPAAGPGPPAPGTRRPRCRAHPGCRSRTYPGSRVTSTPRPMTPRQVGAQLEHGAVQGRGRVVRRDLAPDQVHQPVDGHDRAGTGGERSQQCRLPTAGQREPGAVGCRERHLTQHPDQHGSSGDQATEEAEAPHGSATPRQDGASYGQVEHRGPVTSARLRQPQGGVPLEHPVGGLQHQTVAAQEVHRSTVGRVDGRRDPGDRVRASEGRDRVEQERPQAAALLGVDDLEREVRRAVRRP